VCRATASVAEGINGWQAERLPYNNWSDIDGIFPSIDDNRISDRVRDASIEKPVLRDMFRLFITVCLGGTPFGTTNTGGRIESERIAIDDSGCLFAADALGTETIAAGSSGKRLCLSSGRASGE